MIINLVARSLRPMKEVTQEFVLEVLMLAAITLTLSFQTQALAQNSLRVGAVTPAGQKTARS